MGRGSESKGASPATIWMVFTFVFLFIILALLGVLLFLVFNNRDLKWTINQGNEADMERLSQSCNRSPSTTPTSYASSVPDILTTISTRNMSVSTNETEEVEEKDTNAYSELTEEELINILDFLMSDAKLELVHTDQARTRDNYVYSMELMLPPKEEMLNYLEGNGDKPQRQAKVIIMEGNHPRVQEIIVSPLPVPIQWIKHDIIGKNAFLNDPVPESN